MARTEGATVCEVVEGCFCVTGPPGQIYAASMRKGCPNSNPNSMPNSTTLTLPNDAYLPPPLTPNPDLKTRLYCSNGPSQNHNIGPYPSPNPYQGHAGAVGHGPFCMAPVGDEHPYSGQAQSLTLALAVVLALALVLSPSPSPNPNSPTSAHYGYK